MCPSSCVTLYQVDRTLSRQAGRAGTILPPPSREFAALSSDMQNYNTTALLCGATGTLAHGISVRHFLQLGKITTQTIKQTKYSEKCCFNILRERKLVGHLESSVAITAI